MMDDSRPILTRKKIIVAVVVFLVLFGAGSFALLYKGAGQNADSQEPQLEFAAEGSKIAGIQKLMTSGGLSWTQYKKVYNALNEELPELEPESRYFNLVEDSVGSFASENAGRVDIAIEPADYNTYTDPNEVIYEEDPSMITEREEMESVDTVSFTMQAESGTEYAVEVYTAGDLETAKVKIEKK